LQMQRWRWPHSKASSGQMGKSDTWKQSHHQVLRVNTQGKRAWELRTSLGWMCANVHVACMVCMCGQQRLFADGSVFLSRLLSKADPTVKEKEQSLQENSFFVFSSVSNWISFFTNIFELIYPN
jgi:hypothetical protein